jgi:predicted MFS family arabinose efflux permease
VGIPHLKRFGAFSIIGTVSLMPLLVLPAMIGVLVDNAGMSEQWAGWSASANFMASAVIGMLVALRVHHLNLRRLTTWALTFAIAADLASGLTAGSLTIFFAARIVAGIMLGVTYVAAVSSLARYDGFERGFGLYVTLQFIVSGLGLYVVPVYADQMGAMGLFGGFAVLDLVALGFARFLPSEKAASSGESESRTELNILLGLTAIMAILGFAAFEAANNAQFTYIERFGVFLDVSDRQIGFSLLIASLVGIPGAFSIVVVGQRFGTLVPLVFGIAIAMAGQAILLFADSYVAYFIGSCCMGFSWAFCLPFIQSFLATIDRKGSAIAAGTSLATLGSAIGPGLAAVVVADNAYGNVFMLSIGLFVVTLLLFVVAAKSKRKAV